jgi:APA family basic amino acid/polyamine antiporter
MTSTRATHLQRELGVFGAMMMGLGSIIGTGVFVSIGLAAGVTGPSVTGAILLAAGVALCNALSSAQLAANHPVSGGTYEYGYRYAHPVLGFLAGWMFLWAKSASAATAALGFASSFSLLGFGFAIPERMALAAVVILTLLVMLGIRRSSWANIAIVSLSLLTLLTWVAFLLPEAWQQRKVHYTPFFDTIAVDRPHWQAFLEATALMFVAYTGYGRIATLGEEVRDPRTTIPRAIHLTLAVSSTLYFLVGLALVGGVGAATAWSFARDSGAPLGEAAQHLGFDWLSKWVGFGAVTALLGVLLNLILGLSRVLLAMGRRGDMPRRTARLNSSGTTPVVAVPAMGAVIAGLVYIGDLHSNWSFSAFTVLVYYAITNYCALRLPEEERFYPRWIAAAGLLSCLGLAFFVEARFWMTGLGLLLVGAVWHRVARWMRE